MLPPPCFTHCIEQCVLDAVCHILAWCVGPECVYLCMCVCVAVLPRAKRSLRPKLCDSLWASNTHFWGSQGARVRASTPPGASRSGAAKVHTLEGGLFWGFFYYFVHFFFLDLYFFFNKLSGWRVVKTGKWTWGWWGNTSPHTDAASIIKS